jgi:uncharacterized protein YndB with AHSA1/START domain
MAKRVHHELTYDAPAAQVYKMLTDAAFREEACARMKVLRSSVTAQPAGDDTVVTIDQVQPATGLPSFATKLVGDEIRIVQEETWTGPTHADVKVTIPGRPGEMVGTADLVESDGRTTETVELEITVRIPLVGGRIEGLVADMLAKALRAENEAGRVYLSR